MTLAANVNAALTHTPTPRRVREVQYARPHLYPAQLAAIYSPARYAYIEASTKAGKTHGCIVWLTEQAVLGPGNGANYWWIAPSIGQAKIAYERLKRMLPDWSFTTNRTERTIVLANGAVIWFKTGEQPDNLYGEDVYAAVMDEASRMRASVFLAIRSTITATGGHLRMIGNVAGARNWFWRRSRQAEAEQLANASYHRLTVWDAVEAGVFDRAEAEDARSMLSTAEFKELYEAQAADMSQQFFHVEKISTVKSWPQHARMVRAWDFAISPLSRTNPDPDWTTSVKMAIDGIDLYIIDVTRDRVGPGPGIDKWRSVAIADGVTCDQIIEQERGASGAQAVEWFKREATRLRRDGAKIGKVSGVPLSGNKAARAMPLAGRVNDERVHMVEAGWNDILIREFDEFTTDPRDYAHDDIVDSSSHAANWLSPKPAAQRGHKSVHRPGRR